MDPLDFRRELLKETLAKLICHPLLRCCSVSWEIGVVFGFWPLTLFRRATKNQKQENQRNMNIHIHIYISTFLTGFRGSGVSGLGGNLVRGQGESGETGGRGLGL